MKLRRLILTCALVLSGIYATTLPNSTTKADAATVTTEGGKTIVTLSDETKYEKLTSVDSITDDGTYIIGYYENDTKNDTSSKNAFLGTFSDSSFKKATQDSDILKLSIKKAATAKYTISYVSGTNTNYFSYSGSSNNIQQSTTLDKKGYWNITYDGKEKAFKVNSLSVTARYLQYNSAANGLKFACYKNTQNDLSIYKQMQTEPNIKLELDAESSNTLYVNNTAHNSAVINATIKNAETYTVNWKVDDESVLELLDDGNSAIVAGLVGEKTGKVTAELLIGTDVVASDSLTFTTVTAAALTAPTVAYSQTTNTISWNAIANATNYKLQIFKEGVDTAQVDETLAADVLDYIPNVEPGNYSVSVTALGNELEYLNSTAGTIDFTYQVSATAEFAQSISTIKTTPLLGLSYTSASEEKTDTMSYSGTTESPVEGTDIVSKYNMNLDPNKYSINVYKGKVDTTSVSALNKDGSLRLYKNKNSPLNGSYVVVTSKQNIISKISLTFTGATYSNVSVYLSIDDISDETKKINPVDNVYNINSDSFVLINQNGTEQVQISSMSLSYTGVTNTYTNTRARFKVNVPTEVYENELLKNAEAKWGVAITINGKTNDLVMADSNIINKGTSYEFVASVTNIPVEHYKTMIHAVGYVEYTYEGEKVRHDMISTEYSIETMVKTYLAGEAGALTDEQRAILEDFNAKYFAA